MSHDNPMKGPTPDVDAVSAWSDTDRRKAETYRYVRERRPDVYRHVVEVGSCVTCAPTGADRLTMGAAAEMRAMEIVAQLLHEQEGGSRG